MTQENAADRAQNLNELNETTDAVESFAQDWLAAEGLENGEESKLAKSPRVVATLPDWSTFAESTGVARRKGWNWREILRDGRTKTTGVALAAFGLGLFCAPGGWRNGEKETNAPETAAVDVEKSGENETAFDLVEGKKNDVPLATIDSSTLRSVPNVAGVGFETQAPTATAKNAVSNDGGKNNGFVEDAAWACSNGQHRDGASANGSENGQIATTEATTGDSNWRRGVDFERGLETTSETTASAERFPTWEDLETNVDAPSVEEILNSPVGADVASFAPGSTVVANAPVASGLPVANNIPVVANAPVASGSSVANNLYSSENLGTAQNSNSWSAQAAGTSAGYAAYNGGAGYQGNNGANLNGGAPQFAGNSQNSGYNQANGSENFAGWPTATPNFASSSAPVPSFAAPVASGAPTGAEAPRAMVAQVPNENASGATPSVPATNPNLRW
ncbi:MAG: hypothetical protein IKK39_10800 [Thermoguttaceae bacterium]|nr:hypothetical protein [Thermoguttaceae bacterium]